MSKERRFNNTRRTVVDEILSERAYQLQRWAASDETKTPSGWLTVLIIYIGKAAQELHIYQGVNYDKKRFRKRLVQLAAVCMAAIESL